MLILDDVFAELDTGRRDRLAALVAGAEQVLITAAVPADVPDVLAGARFSVHGGRGQPCQLGRRPATPDEPRAPIGARLAVEALAAAKADARARGDLPAWRASRGRVRAMRPNGPACLHPARMTRPGRDRARREPAGRGSGRARGRPRREDPQPLASAIDGLLDTRGWQQQAAMGSVFGRWAEIVGHGPGGAHPPG